MSTEISTEIASFKENDITVRVIRGLFGILPFAPDWKHLPALDAATGIKDPALAARVAQRAAELAEAEGPQAALKAFTFMDKGDKGIALFTGLRGAVKVAQGDTAAALEMDPQQAADAGLKVLGIAYAAYKLYPGTPQEKLKRLSDSEIGRALLIWYVAVDVVLPFTDNLVSGGADVVGSIIDKYAAENTARLEAVAGSDTAAAAGMLASLSGTLRTWVGQAAGFAQPINAWASERLPTLLGGADKITGVVATSIDALSSYRYIGTRLVTEWCVQEAKVQVEAEVAAEKAEAERRAREEAERRAREEAERRAREEAERIRKQKEEEEARIRSSQQENYSLDKAEAASSLRLNPIKVTRGTDVAPRADAVPEKKGCLGCGAMVLLVFVGTAAASWLMV